MEKTELIVDKIGSRGKYQIFISILLLIAGMGNDFTTIFLTLQISFPEGSYINKLGEKVTGVVDYEFCKAANGKENIVVDFNKSVHNWALENEIYCDSFKTTLLSNSLFIGYIIGLILLHLLGSFKKEYTIKFFIFIFCASINIIFVKNYYALVGMSIILGACHIVTFLLRCAIITEATDKKSRSYFLTLQILSGIFMGIACPFIYKSGIDDFKYVYLGVEGLVFLIWIFLVFLLKVSPRYLVLIGDIDTAVENAISIARLNNRFASDFEDNEDTGKIDRNEVKRNLESQISSPVELEQWIRKNYLHIDGEGLLLEEGELDNNSEFHERLQLQDSELTEQDKAKGENINIVFLTIMHTFFTLFLYINVFEVGRFASRSIDEEDNSFQLWFMLSMELGLILFAIWSILMNSTLGRKGTIIFSTFVCLITRLISVSFLLETPMYLYFIERSFSNSTQIPISALLNENFTNRSRVKVYALVSLIVQVFALLVPVIINFSANLVVDILYILFCFLTITSTIFTRETNMKDLKDK